MLKVRHTYQSGSHTKKKGRGRGLGLPPPPLLLPHHPPTPTSSSFCRPVETKKCFTVTGFWRLFPPRGCSPVSRAITGKAFCWHFASYWAGKWNADSQQHTHTQALPGWHHKEAADFFFSCRSMRTLALPPTRLASGRNARRLLWVSISL